MILNSNLISFYLSESESDCVKFAVEDMRKDIENVLGAKTEYNNSFDLYVGNIGIAAVRDFLDEAGVYYGDIAKRTEGHKVAVEYDKVFLLGNGDLGTIYAIYEFCKSTLGVSPFSFWADAESEKQDYVTVREYLSRQPDYRYRCFAINDEDVLQNLGVRTFDRLSRDDKFGKTLDMAFVVGACKLALRLKYNVIVPSTMLDILNEKERDIVAAVVAHGLYVTTNFYEPLGVSLNTWKRYWADSDKNELKPSYKENKESFVDVWTEYIKAWLPFKNVIWQLGLLDTEYKSDVFYDQRSCKQKDEQRALIYDAISEQYNLICDNSGSESPICFFYADKYAEYFLSDKNLALPDNVIVMLDWHYLPNEKTKDKLRSARSKGLIFSQINTENGAHNLQYPDSALCDKLLWGVRRDQNSCAFLYAGNIREHLFTISVFARYSYFVGDSASPAVDFCRGVFGDEKASKAYEDLSNAIVKVNKVPICDVLLYKITDTILDNITRKNGLHYLKIGDEFGVKIRFGYSEFLRAAENAMDKFLQIMCDVKFVYGSRKSDAYYYSSLYTQTNIYLKAYSFASNLIRYSLCGDKKYLSLAKEDIRAVNALFAEQQYGRWKNAYENNLVDFKKLEKKVENI